VPRRVIPRFDEFRSVELFGFILSAVEFLVHYNK
jgi:hypothetical protein